MSTLATIRTLPSEDAVKINWEDFKVVEALTVSPTITINDEDFAFLSNGAGFVVGIQIQRGFALCTETDEPNPSITDCFPKDAPLTSTWIDLFKAALAHEENSLNLEQRYHALCKISKRTLGYITTWWNATIKPRIEKERAASLAIQRARETSKPETNQHGTASEPKKTAADAQKKHAVTPTKKDGNEQPKKKVADAPSVQEPQPPVVDKETDIPTQENPSKRPRDEDDTLASRNVKKTRLDEEAQHIVAFLRMPPSAHVDMSVVERAFLDKINASIPNDKKVDEFTLLSAGYKPSTPEMAERVDLVRRCIALYS